MPAGSDDDYRSVVMAHRFETTAFLLADSGECLETRDAEVLNVKGRRLVPITSAELSGLKLPTSWLLAVILCPGDDTAAIAAWTRRLPVADHDRIRFYAHPDADLESALRIWHAVGLRDPPLRSVRGARELARPLGMAINDRIYADHRPV